MFLVIGISQIIGENKKQLPKGFVYLKNIIPNAVVDIKYYSDENFIGKRIEGYEGNKGILTQEAAGALIKVQSELKKNNMGIKIFDAYRPQRAVNHFLKWASNFNDKKMKSNYYPNVNKSDLVKEGYVSKKSSHSRGSTVDITIVNLLTGQELDMGSRYDLFDVKSHVNFKKLKSQQKANRIVLNKVMKKNGFKSYSKEWWHFTLVNEPFKDKYFDFIVK
ncbi:MAG: peptidase M15 [Planctomycetota bacterium]|nr:MAG: peptidase M15 [Planctomycetota bacterium]